MKFSNILLMSGLSLAILVSSCKKDEERLLQGKIA